MVAQMLNPLHRSVIAVTRSKYITASCTHVLYIPQPINLTPDLAAKSPLPPPSSIDECRGNAGFGIRQLNPLIDCICLIRTLSIRHCMPGIGFYPPNDEYGLVEQLIFSLASCSSLGWMSA